MEIHRWIQIRTSAEELQGELDQAVQNGALFRSGEYYGLGDVKGKMEKRLGDKDRCEQSWAGILKSARIISSFPFVRSVAISGTASKGIMLEESDFDFFILTAPNKMWIARTILHLFKKFTFLFGKEHHFCMNYFKDIQDLEILEHSPFTAIELLTLIPAYGHTNYNDLISINSWYKDIFPNAWPATKEVRLHPYWLKYILEILLWPFSWPIINRFLMKWTYAKWSKKWRLRGFDMEQFDRNFKTNLTESKNHPESMARKLEDYLGNS